MYSRLISRTLLPLALIATVFAVSACDNVGVEPKGLAAADNIFQEDGAYRSYLAKLYAGLSTTGQQGPAGAPDIQGIDDEGFSQYVRLWWQMQELPTDEAVLAFPDTPVEEMDAGNWGAENGFISGMYSRVSFQVTQANNFLRESTPGKLDERGVGPEVQQQMSQWRAEARFLRALSYWHGLDLYGGIPIVTEENPVGGAPPSPNSRQEVFEFVEDSLVIFESSITSTGALDRSVLAVDGLVVGEALEEKRADLLAEVVSIALDIRAEGIEIDELGGLHRVEVGWLVAFECIN